MRFPWASPGLAQQRCPGDQSDPKDPGSLVEKSIYNPRSEALGAASGTQWGRPYTYVCTYICIYMFSEPFPLLIITNTEYISLCYTVRPCFLSILYM